MSTEDLREKQEQIEKVFSIVSSKYDTYTKTEKKIADCLMDDEIRFMNYSITQFAKKLGVSAASITRFCQKLNYRGFGELKFGIAYNNVSLPDVGGLLTTQDSTGTIITKLAKLQTAAIQNSLCHLDPHVIRIAARSICKAHTVNIYAEGGPSSVAVYAHSLLFQLGINCQTFSDAQLALAGAMHLKDGDVALYICRGGYSPMIMRAVRAARENRATIIGITSNQTSKLAGLADYLIPYSGLVENDMRYLHIARMCEMSILGVLYNDIISCMPDGVLEKVNQSSKAIVVNQEW